MKQKRVFPECNVDTNLVGHILGGAAMHKSTCNEVVKAVNGSDSFSIGIIDADKRLATMNPGFEEYIENPKADGESKHITMFTIGTRRGICSLSSPRWINSSSMRQKNRMLI